MKLGNSLRRLMKDEQGGAAAEAALLIALVASIVGWGMIVYGDTLANFFAASSTGFDPNDSFPMGVS